MFPRASWLIVSVFPRASVIEATFALASWVNVVVWLSGFVRATSRLWA
jgi:hypothetical protein